MFNISSYLEKFKSLGQGERSLKEVVCLVIKEVVGVMVKIEDIKIKNGELTLNVSPGIKNAIFIKKELILSKIKDKSEEIVLNIR